MVSTGRRSQLVQIAQILSRPSRPLLLADGDVAGAVQRLSDERDALAAALLVVLDDLHPVHGNTAHHSQGGYGASVMTQCCHLSKYNADPGDAETLERVSAVLRTALGDDKDRGRDVVMRLRESMTSRS
jgi:hypothetical protein